MRLCPHCGYDLTQSEPIAIGRWLLLPGSARLHDVMTNLSRNEACIVYTLAKAQGAPVSCEVLANRLTVDPQNPERLIRVMVRNIRKKLGEGLAIRNQHGVGYYVEKGAWGLAS